ncbi:MAG: GldM family protein [Flavobacteriaceae bacterium]
MAAGKQDTRQKMINMMYLVFIAMLALNISKEVLATLGVINDDITTSTEALDADSLLRHAVFENNANNDYFKVASAHTPKIKSAADDYYQYVEDLKQYLLNTDKNNFKAARTDKRTGATDTIVDYQTMDKSQYLDEYFFDGDKNTAAGDEFVRRFRAFPNDIQAVLDSLVAADLEKDPPTEALPEGEYADFDFSSYDEVIERFAYNDELLNREGKYQPYLEYHFQGFPLIASLSKLTKLQHDIRYAENRALELILATISGHEGGLNKYQTLLESSKSSYYTNDLIDASVVMGKKDSNFKPDRAELSINGRPLVDGRDYDIAAGGVQLKTRFSNPGSYVLTGKLFFERNKEELSVDVNQQISVIDKPNDAVISADQMKVVYQGLPNPLSISIPGIPNDKLMVSAENGSITRKGTKFEAIPDGDKPGQFMKIFVSGEINGQQIQAPPQDFKIKPLPPAFGSIDLGDLGKYAKGDVPKSFLPAGIIGAKFPDDFDYQLDIKINGFKVKIGNYASEIVEGNRIMFNEQAESYIETARPEDFVYIFDIDAEVRAGNQVLKDIRVLDFVVSLK